MARHLSLPTAPHSNITNKMQCATDAGDLEAVRQLIHEWRFAKVDDGGESDLAEDEIRDILGESITASLIASISDLLEEGAPVPGWMSAFCIDHAADPISALEALLSHGWDINGDDEIEGTPLVQAINTEDARVVSWLLEHGANPNAPAMKELEEWRVCRDFYHVALLRKPLDFAAALCSVDILVVLLDHGACLDQSNAMHAAAGSSATDRFPIVQCLLDRGMDVNALEFARDREFASVWGGVRAFGTPLHYAFERGNRDMVKFLIERGAREQLRDPLLRRTPAEWAELGSHYREWVAVESRRVEYLEEPSSAEEQQAWTMSSSLN